MTALEQEIWSETEEDWVEHTRKQDDAAEEDDDEEHKKYLFYVKHRFLPKQPTSEGFVVVQFKRSQHIVDCLRSIMKHVEELQDDKASVDAKELFLAEEQIRITLSNLKEEVEARKDEANDEEDKAEDRDQKHKAADSESKSSAVKEESPEVAVKTEEEETAAAPDRMVPVQEQENSSGSVHEEEDADAEESKVIAKVPYAELKEKVEHIEILLEFIAEHFASIQGKLDRIVPKGMISFKLLWCVIKPGMIVKMNHQASGEPVSPACAALATRLTIHGVTLARDDP